MGIGLVACIGYWIRGLYGLISKVTAQWNTGKEILCKQIFSVSYIMLQNKLYKSIQIRCHKYALIWLKPILR